MASSFRIFLLPQHNEVIASVSWKLELLLPRPIIGCTNIAYWEAPCGFEVIEGIYWSIGGFFGVCFACFVFNLKIITLSRHDFVKVICKYLCTTSEKNVMMFPSTSKKLQENPGQQSGNLACSAYHQFY